MEVEITEAFLMSDWVRAQAVLEALRELGVRVSVDDFGTGYSSLASPWTATRQPSPSSARRSPWRTPWA